MSDNIFMIQKNSDLQKTDVVIIQSFTKNEKIKDELNFFLSKNNTSAPISQNILPLGKPQFKQTMNFPVLSIKKINLLEVAEC